MNHRRRIGQTKTIIMRTAVVAMIAGMLLSWRMVDQAVAQAVGNKSGNRPALFLGNDSLPPMNFLKNGKPTGVVIELTEALSKRMHRPVEIRLMNWAEAQQLVLDGRADALLQINPNPERLKMYDFSEPLLTSEFTIFISGERVGVASMRDLRGLKVGVEKEGLPISLLQEDPEIIVEIIPDFIRGFKMLAKGKLDAVVVDRWVGGYVLAENNIRGVKLVEEPISRSHSAIAVKKGNATLLGEINAALADIRRDGTYDRIIKSWQSKEVVFKTREQLRQQVLLIAVITAALIVALVAVAVLIREIRRRRRVEETLRESERRLIGVLESMPDAFVSFDADMHYTYVNANAERLQAARRKELIGKQVRVIYPDAESYKTISQYERAIREQKPVTSTSYHAGFDRWVEIRAFPTPDGVSVFYKDVSAQVKADEALRTSEEKYRNLFENMAEEVHFWQLLRDEAGRIITWRLVDANPPALKTWGRGSLEEIRGKTTDEIFGPGAVEHYMSVVQKIFTEGVPHSFEDYFPNLDKHFRFTSVPLGDYFITTGADITAIKKAEEALRASEEKARNLIKYAPTAIFEVDFNATRFLSVNEATCDLSGYTRGELLAMSPLSLTDGPSTNLFRDWARRKLSGEKAEDTGEYTVNTKDGRKLSIVMRASAFTYQEGEPVTVLVIGHDITERKRAEEELRKAHNELERRVQERTAQLEEANARLKNYNRQLEALNKELQDFAFVASHDLAEPLRKIQTFGYLLADKCAVSLNETSRDYISRMQSAAARMQSLLNSLLLYSRMTTRAEPLKEIDLNQTVEEALSNLEVTIKEKNAIVEIGELPTLKADWVQMVQLFQNLIGNALKFGRRGEAPHVKIHAKEVEDNKGAYEICVEDRGIGFDEKFADKIFLPFQRLHGRISEYEGVGMGLAICRKVVDRHSGAITARSEPGKGSTFIVTLPRKRKGRS
jgi:PAS domain S-box-containing protein